MLRQDCRWTPVPKQSRPLRRLRTCVRCPHWRQLILPTHLLHGHDVWGHACGEDGNDTAEKPATATHTHTDNVIQSMMHI